VSGPLEFAGEELLEAFPQLKEIELLDRSRWERNGLTYPQAIRLEIFGCLKYPDGPSNPPQMPSCGGNTLLDFVTAELAGLEQQHNLGLMEVMIMERGLSITSTYWYRVSVTEHLSWPFCERRQAMNEVFETEIVWNKEGMHLTDVVDLRDKEWWDDIVRPTPGWREPPLNNKNARFEPEEMFSTIGDWDMFKIPLIDEDVKRWWVDVVPMSSEYCN
jgi:hypothetical protein